MKNNQLTKPVKALLVASCIALVAVLFVPMWKIELAAPQYPEGLVLKIYPHKLGGNVDIINGLNHYIGMKTLHTEDFMEFTLLPYIISIFAALCLVVLFLNRKKWLYLFTVLFVVFGIVAMVDFWRWEYNYGHQLNPEAAIQVPGMAYQPPLIGYKQLLNFGAYSIPDIGGFLFFGVGLILVLCMILLILHARRNRSSGTGFKKMAASIVSCFALVLCSCNTNPQPIKIGIDACDFCKMTITDNRFGGEIITQKGKIYKFDDIHCLLSFKKSTTLQQQPVSNIYLINFEGQHNLIPADKAFLFKSDELRTPMGGNIAAFESEHAINTTAARFHGISVHWNDIVR